MLSLLKSRTYVYCDEQKIRRRRKSTSSSAADSPIPPPPIRSAPYPLSTPYPGMSTTPISGYPQHEHDHQNAQYILQHHQQRQQQQQINRNSHSMQNMAGSFNGPTPPMSMRGHMQQQHRTIPSNNCSEHVRYDCSIDPNNSQNVFINQNLNRLTSDCVTGLSSIAPNQIGGVSYQHKNCGNVTSQGKHYSS